MTRQDERDVDDVDATTQHLDVHDGEDAAVREEATVRLDRSEDALSRGEDALVAEPDRLAMQDRWTQAQGRFVDDPRAAVREADALVSEVVQAVTRRFAEQRDALEQQWDRDDEPDTEQLRQALQRYRDLFSRLLAA